MAAAFRALRESLRLEPIDLVERAGRQGLTVYDISRLENGHTLLQSKRKKVALAIAFGVTSQVIEALAALKITPEAVATLAREAVANAPLEPVPSHDPATRTAREGQRLASLTKLAHLKNAKFPNLELCLLYFEANGEPWPEAAVKMARSGYLSAEDLPTPAHWSQVLEKLTGALHVAAPPKAPEETPRSDS